MDEARITDPFVGVLRQPVCWLLIVCAGASLAWTTPSAAPAPGRVEGIVRLVAPESTPIVSGSYPTRRVTRQAAGASEISNVIVFVPDAARQAALPISRTTIVQQGEAFVPRTVAITRGSTIEFPNADPFFHNVFSLSRGAAFDLGRFPRGESRFRTFTRPGLVKVYCHIHSHMTASIMVFDHPHFTVPEADGNFALRDVPAGTLRVSAWHERIGESVKPVVIEPGRIARVEFALPVEERMVDR